LAEHVRDPVGLCLWRHAGPGRGPGDVVTVLVGPREEPDAVAGQTMPARHRVGQDRRVRVAEVRLGVDVVDRGREIENAVAHPRGSPSGGALSGSAGRTWSRPSHVSWLSGTSASVEPESAPPEGEPRG